MTWDEAMQFYPAAKEMARTWANKMNRPDDEEDLAQHLMIMLVERVDLSRARGNRDAYVAGALWKKAHSFFFGGKQRHWLDLLPLMVDSEGEIDVERYGFKSRKNLVNLWTDGEAA